MSVEPDVVDSRMAAPAPSLKIIESRSCISIMRDKVSVPITRHFVAVPDLIKQFAWMTASTQPGHPNAISYATQLGLCIPSLAFIRDAIEGTWLTLLDSKVTSPKLCATII